MPVTNFGLSRAQVNKAVAAGSAVSPNALSMQITVQGLNAVADHWYAVAEFTHNGAGAIVDFTGQLLTNLAKEIHRPHILTQDTFKSIGPTDEGTNFNGASWQVEVGPETQQARFLEWGFLHRPDNTWIQYPFMIPAAETVAPLFFDAMAQVAAIAAITAPLAGSPAVAARDALDSARDRLYSASKFLGDLQILGVRTPSALRTGLVSTAQILGDVSAAVRGSIGKRITTRVSGRFIQGSLQASTTATVTGPSNQYRSGANRLYNRFAGRATSQNILQRF
jgi:hypothetical protein